jgi:mxaJ protein
MRRRRDLTRVRLRRAAAATLGAVLVGLLWAESPAAQAAERPVLRVCADPNNLPFSNRQGEGFENKLAELVARELGEKVAYTWWAQRRGFIRSTLKTGSCDVVMGVPVGLDMVETTRPYYRSSYVFVSRSDRQLNIASMTDPRLRALKIGVQLIGDDGFNTPPGHALAKQGIVDNVVGYTVYGDYRRPDPPAQILEAVAQGEIDIAAVWGPLAGYFARKSPVKLTVLPITDTERFSPLLFQFDIAIGVRKGDDKRKEELDRLVARNSVKIAQILDRYGVPVTAADQERDGENPK